MEKAPPYLMQNFEIQFTLENSISVPLIGGVLVIPFLLLQHGKHENRNFVAENLALLPVYLLPKVPIFS